MKYIFCEKCNKDEKKLMVCYDCNEPRYMGCSKACRKRNYHKMNCNSKQEEIHIDNQNCIKNDFGKYN